MNLPSLNTQEKITLRKQAHHLQPVIFIGHRGLTSALLSETKQSLTAHELIKIRTFGPKEELNNLVSEICKHLQALPIQKIGKTFVIWKKSEKKIEPDHPGHKLSNKKNTMGGSKQKVKKIISPLKKKK